MMLLYGDILSLLTVFVESVPKFDLIHYLFMKCRKYPHIIFFRDILHYCWATL